MANNLNPNPNIDLNLNHKKFSKKDVIQEVLINTLKMLNPRVQIKNPTIFVCYVCAITTTYYVLIHTFKRPDLGYNVQLIIWLWLTVLVANLAETLAKIRSKIHAGTLKENKQEIYVRWLKNNKEFKIPSSKLCKGDLILCSEGDIIPADGEAVEGVAVVDESAITGESACVMREAGGDRSSITSGTKVISGEIKIRIAAEKGKGFLDHMRLLSEGMGRRKSSNELTLNLFLNSIAILVILVVCSLELFVFFSQRAGSQEPQEVFTIPILAALIVCLLPTMISAMLNTISISGLNKAVRKNFIVNSFNSLEIASHVELLVVDKTGTLTSGIRIATAFLPLEGITEKELANVCLLSSIHDETTEGRSIATLSKTQYGVKADDLNLGEFVLHPFSSFARISGIDILEKGTLSWQKIRKGAPDEIQKYITALGGFYPLLMDEWVKSIAMQGNTPLVICDHQKVLGIIVLKDMVKLNMKENFLKIREMGIRSLMVTGDTPLLAAAIAAETGVDDFIAEASSQIKLDIIKKEQKKGVVVAMIGDGTSDSPSLAQADLGVVMNSGTQIARESANIIDLDNNPSKILELILISKQILTTRNVLFFLNITTIIVKYFLIFPVIMAAIYISSKTDFLSYSFLSIFKLHSYQSAILSTLIFNVLMIAGAIPLALHGLSYKNSSVKTSMGNRLLIYGLGGVIGTFCLIKLIDNTLVLLGAV